MRIYLFEIFLFGTRNPRRVRPRWYVVLAWYFDSKHTHVLVRTDFVPPQMRRRLILIAKVIQNLASGVRFGTKEQYLQDMNAFLDQGTPAVHLFYDRMTVSHTCTVRTGLKS